jgi:hypothetical protein
LAIGLFQFWIQAGYVAESIDIYRNLLASPKAAVPHPLRAKALAFLSLSHLRLGDHKQALSAAQTVLAFEMSQRGEGAANGRR